MQPSSRSRLFCERVTLPEPLLGQLLHADCEAAEPEPSFCGS